MYGILRFTTIDEASICNYRSLDMKISRSEQTQQRRQYVRVACKPLEHWHWLFVGPSHDTMAPMVTALSVHAPYNPAASRNCIWYLILIMHHPCGKPFGAALVYYTFSLLYSTRHDQKVESLAAKSSTPTSNERSLKQRQCALESIFGLGSSTFRHR